MPTTLEKALEYAELGYSVIPLAHGQKYPINEKWQQYAYETPTEDEIRKQWGSANYNVGIVCGPASKVVGVDIDDDEVLKDPMIPISNVARRGAKGEVRLFRWREGLSNYSGEKVQLLVDRRFFVVPPGGHPDGMNYEWTRGPLCEPDELPELTDEVVAHITKTYPTRSGGPGGGGGPRNGGRNTSLTANITAWRHNETMDVDELAQMALEYDIKNHSHNPLFFDMTEQYAKKAGPGLPAAKVMVTNILKTIGDAPPPTELKIMSGKTVPKVEVVEDEEEEEEEEKEIEAPEVPLPEYPDLLFERVVKDVTNLGYEEEDDVKAFGYAATISLMSICAGNRVALVNGRMTKTATLVYILGNSGLGKDGAKSFLEQVFSGKFAHLRGQGKRGSAQVLIHDVAKKRNILDIQDEYHTEIRKMFGKNTVQSQSAIPTTINELYSANFEYSPSTSMGGKKEKMPELLFSPYYCLFAAGTIESLLRAIPNGDIDCFNNGFFNRFLFFLSKPSFKERGVEDFLRERGQLDAKYYHDMIDNFNSRYPLLNKNGVSLPEEFGMDGYVGSCFYPKILNFDNAGKIAWAERMTEYNKKRNQARMSGDLITEGLLSRIIENACRIATSLAAFKYKDYVGAEEFDWAMRLVEYSFSSVHPLFTELGDRVAHNDFAGIEDRVILKLSETKPGQGIAFTKLKNSFRRTLSSKQLLDALNAMTSTGILTRTKYKGGFTFALTDTERKRFKKK